MMHARAGWAAIAAAAVLLAACGGSDDPVAPPVGAVPPPVAVATRAEVLATTTAGMGGIAFSEGYAYVSVANSASAGSGVFQARLPLKADSSWTGTLLGDCGIDAEHDGFPLRTPGLRKFDSGLWLFQSWADKGPDARIEHSLCALKADRSGFEALDKALEVCLSGSCYKLSPSELKQVGQRLYTNAGGGKNVFVSTDQGASWKVLTGQFDSMSCYDAAFEIVGDRLLVGGECPLDSAYLEAYQLNADGTALVSPEPLPIKLPELENRNLQFITTLGKRVFAGVEGGLLRSDDGGRSFQFVIHQPLEEAATKFYIQHVIALDGKPDSILAAGFDKSTLKPYLAWSVDGGGKWTEISSALPGWARNLDAPFPAEITAMTQDPQGRILLTVNEQQGQQGRVVLLTLGTPPQ